MKRFVGIVSLLLLLTGCATTIHCPVCGFDFDPDKAQELAQERESRRVSVKR